MVVPVLREKVGRDGFQSGRGLGMHQRNFWELVERLLLVGVGVTGSKNWMRRLLPEKFPIG